MDTNYYRIPNQNMALLKVQFDEINKKAAKLKMPPVAYTVVATDKETVRTQTRIGMIEEVINYSIVEVCGNTPKYGGWEFVGTMQPKGDVNIFFAVPGHSIPENFRDNPNYCDHCKSNRYRKLTYVVYHEEAGTYKQVGSSCINDFLGGKSPHGIASYLELIEFAVTALKEAQEGSGSYSGIITAKSIEWLSWVNCIARHIGFVSRKNAEATYRESTSDAAYGCMFVPATPSYDPTEFKINGEIVKLKPEDIDKQTAADAIEWVRSWTQEEINESEYKTNLYYVCKEDFFTVKELGIAASVISSYYRHVNSKLESENKNPKVHVGVLKQRKVIDNLKVVNEFVYDGTYGVTRKYILEDVDGNTLTWSTNKQALSIGETYSLKCTIDEHSLYKGVPQTKITRCIVEAPVGG